jgi:aminoglycoside phosphotransferase (APT) family kinase protein
VNLDRNQLAGRLEAVMAAPLGKGLRVADIAPLKGGYSRRMWAFDVIDSAGERSPWILCTDSSQGVVGDDSLPRHREAALLEHANRAGIPAPAIAAAGERGALEEPFGVAWFVMERLMGTAAVGPLVRNPALIARRRAIGQRKAEILADIHRLPLPVGAFPDLPPPDEVASFETQRWSRALERTPNARTTTMNAAVAVLRRTRPRPPTRLCIVHGDYRTGNLLYDPDGTAGITGVLDWEMAHPGDPLEDVAWAQLASWRVGTGLVGALVTDDEWIADYRHASGVSIDAGPLTFWQVLTGVKMSVLAWRAVEATPAGKEHDLLIELFEQLQAQLEQRIEGL